MESPSGGRRRGCGTQSASKGPVLLDPWTHSGPDRVSSATAQKGSDVHGTNANFFQASYNCGMVTSSSHARKRMELKKRAVMKYFSRSFHLFFFALILALCTSLHIPLDSSEIRMMPPVGCGDTAPTECVTGYVFRHALVYQLSDAVALKCAHEWDSRIHASVKQGERWLAVRVSHALQRYHSGSTLPSNVYITPDSLRKQSCWLSLRLREAGTQARS